MRHAIREQIHADLRAAIKARDRLRVSVLRTTLAAVANAEAVDPNEVQPAAGLLADVRRKDLSEAEVRAIVARERDEMRHEAEQLRGSGRSEVQDLETKADILDVHLNGGERDRSGRLANGRRDLRIAPSVED